MPIAQRQTNLFVAEDWRVIYRAFTEVNFAAYDFDTIRAALVDFIRINFPEDFNDWIESSEFVALIELLAYMGQSLAFRTDLNTRENFLDTAERRESILRLARFISFIPSRNRAANGLVKITRLSTTQPLVDSNGQNIASKTIRWNDPNNPDWFEQFILILNSVFNTTNPFGRPTKSGLVDNIRTELYTLNNEPSANKVFPFNININGESQPFEIVNTDFNNGETFFEREPDPEDPLHLVYRNDGQGNSSPDSGFFFLFKQGTLNKEDFLLQVPVENRLLNVDRTLVNNTDVWVQDIDEDGFIIDKWTKVPAVTGNNIIFNSLERDIRNIFSVITRTSDQISIRFADGRFGNVPVGLFRVWFRQSAGKRFAIKPEDMRDIRLDIPYFDGVNNDVFFSSFTFGLQETVRNSAPADTSADIKNNAPQIFYTQDRMVNGEDYNVFPLQNPEAAKIKAVNRIYSGFSRHIDINDPTGQSQNVNLFAEDGLLFLESNQSLEELALPTTYSESEITSQIILPLIQTLDRRHFYFFNYPRFEPTVASTENAVVGITGTEFDATDEPWTSSAAEILEITDGVNTASIVMDLSIIGELAATIKNAITLLNVGLAGATPAPLSNIVVRDGVDLDSGGSGQESVQLIDETTDRNITITQVSGTFWSDVGILEPSESSRILVPRVYGTFWMNAVNAVNSSSGRFFIDVDGVGTTPSVPIKIGDAVTPSLPEFHITEGSLIKFNQAGWVAVSNVTGDGDTVLVNGDGSVLLAEPVNDFDYVEEIIPPFRTQFTDSESNNVTQQLIQKNSFGIRWDYTTHTWKIITGENIDTDSSFSFEYSGDITGLNRDSSWLVRAEYSPTYWRFIARGLDMVFESTKEVRFYFDENIKIVDPNTGRAVIDFIKVLGINSVIAKDTEILGLQSAVFTPGETIIINGTTITLDSGGTIDSAVADINQRTVGYDIPDPVVPGDSIIINGVQVEFFVGTALSHVIDEINMTFSGGDVVASDDGNGKLELSSEGPITVAAGIGSALVDLRLLAGTFYGLTEVIARNNFDRIQLISSSAITLEEGSGTALSDLGLTEGTFVNFVPSTPCAGLGENIEFNVESQFTEDDGYANPRRVKLTFTDTDEDGIPDDPTILERITCLTNYGTYGGEHTLSGILPDAEIGDTSTYIDVTELFWESFTDNEGFLEYQPSTSVKLAFNDNADITIGNTAFEAMLTNAPPAGYGLSNGDVIFARDTQEFFQIDTTRASGDQLVDVTENYYIRRGRNDLFFQWKHFAPIENRIDPAITNIIDIYALTTTYDIELRQWIDDNGLSEDMPVPPTTQDLTTLFSNEVDNKMISDEIIWHPVSYKLLFGAQSDTQLQARFKVTKVPGTEVSDGEIKARIIGAFNEFFAINNFDFGETFYFTELAAFVHQRLATVIGSIVLVPLDEEQKFGELFQVRSEPNEVFISAAKVSDIQIVEAFNDNILRIGN